MTRSAKILRSLALAFFVALGFTLQAQNAVYESGRLFLKVKDAIDLELPVFENVDQRDAIQDFPELISLYQTYGVHHQSKPFKTPAPAIQKIYHLYFDQTDRTEALLNELNALGYLEYAEKVPVYHTTHNPNDLGIDQWGLNKIQPFQAWDISFGEEYITVAVVDDAVMLTHEDLASEIWTNPGEIANNGIDDDNNGFIDDVNGWDFSMEDNDPNPPNNSFSHGTHVAGIAAAATNNSKGVASIGYRVKIMPCKVKNDTTSGESLQNTVEGIDYAILNRADVVNMSFGGSGFSFTTQTLITTGHNLGVTFVAAAGNDDLQVQSFPAAYEFVISVASTGLFDAKSSFSNYHQSVDVSAPGSAIVSTVPGTGGDDYASFSGTSMASPMTAGLCALILSVDSSLTPDEVENCLKAGCENIDAMNSQYIGRMGAGRLHAHNTLLCLSATSREIDEKLNWKGFVTDQIYPNPVAGGEEITFSGSFSHLGELRINLLDLQGRTVASVWEGQVPADRFAFDWPVANDLQQGMYLVSWEFDGERKVQRLVVRR